MNAISPGALETAPTAAVAAKMGKTKQELLEQLAGLVPMGHVGEASDGGAAIAFLASDAAKYITGIVVNVDGGMRLTSWGNKAS